MYTPPTKSSILGCIIRGVYTGEQPYCPNRAGFASLHFQRKTEEIEALSRHLIQVDESLENRHPSASSQFVSRGSGGKGGRAVDGSDIAAECFNSPANQFLDQ